CASRADVEVRGVSCLGRCDVAPAAAVDEAPVAAADVEVLLKAIDRAKAPHAEARLSPPPSRRWASDPYGDEASRYGVLATVGVPAGLTADAVITTLKASGLRGMGGAGFPTGTKWELVKKELGDVKYVVCNADESEPGTFKDRVILDELPHLVIEGMAIAARVVGAREGIVFIRHEYGPEERRLAKAIQDARARGVVGPGFDLRIAVSPGGYILGEETALLECLEDGRGEPRNKPPFPGQKGLFGKPTLINNVETFSLVPIILKEGADAWRARGARGATGLKFIALSGDVERPGVYQVPMGTTIGELVAMGGGVKGGRAVLAIAPGGASSNFLGPEAMEAPLDFQALAERGSMLGSGAVFVVAEGADLVDLATNLVAFFRNESCGKCVPCRVGSEKAVAILEQAVRGNGSKRHLALLPQLGETLTETSICGLGQVALNPFLSVQKRFPELVAARFVED
ncbi:MAG TPA: NADH-ubiquinone oxidoreductase-F iron-sulfur binding region domain-containing protein, partial [Minicystis sp.]|nr:NADH-ubiquinone oxidoreductase-F iron-sulfur binding region domain-containing protein [Minicystis sp.]